MVMMGDQGKYPIDQIITELDNNCKKNPSLMSTIKLEIDKLLRKVYSDAITQQTGWCMTFKIPQIEVLNLTNIAGIDIHRMSNAFQTHWKTPPTAYMVNDPYYHVLLLFIIYGLRNQQKAMCNSAIALILTRLWNGRRQNYIKYCDPDVMRYVVANMSGKYLPRKFDMPIMLILNHYCHTLLDKYGDAVKQDSYKSKRLFEQCWNRLRQLFVSNMSPNIVTGRSEAKAGLAPLYFAAKEKGLKIATPRTSLNPGDDNEMSSIEQYTSHDYDEFVSNISDYIIMNFQPKYDVKFIKFISDENGSKPEQIKLLLNSIHSNQYADYIRDILELMFKQLQITDKVEVCSPKFFSVVKKRIVSSKHSPTIIQVKNVADLLLERIFDDHIKTVSYSDYSPPVCGRWRAIIFYGFAYNIQKFLCSK